MGRKSKTEKENNISVKSCCKGSADFIKNSKDSVGMFWYIDKDKHYVFLNKTSGTNYKEKIFDSMEALKKYVASL